MSHLHDFARDLITREREPVTTATIVAVFTNLGNPIKGDDAEAQRETVRAVLTGTPGLQYNATMDHWEHAQ